MTLSSSFARAGLLVVTLGLALQAPSARSETAGGRPPAPHHAPAAARGIAPSAMGGMVVGIDPETGMLVMPAPEQLERLLARRQARIAAPRPAPIRRANGTLSLDVGTWMLDYAYVHLGPDGRPIMGCAEGHDAATHAVQSPAPPAALEDR